MTDNRQSVLQLATSPIVALTNANGSGDDTIADVGAAFNQTTLNNNFRDVSDKIAELITRLALVEAKQAEILAALKRNCRAVK